MRSLPGLVGTLILVLTATTMAVGNAASLFYEGWGQPAWRMLGYIAPALVLILLGIVALRWPARGAALLLAVALGAGAWWLRDRMAQQIAPFDLLLTTALMMVGPVVVAALLLLFEARHRRLLRREGRVPASRWLYRHWREVLLLAAPALAVAILSGRQVPALLARADDGLRGARTIAGNGVTLIWAPEGPGWGWDGTPPADRCAHLDEDGTVLLPTRADIWRTPTADEIIRSLTRGGRNAGCAWDRRSPHADCGTPPDKETPLWAPDRAPIYYWSSEGPDADSAFAVNYTGGISALPRARANRGVGFRCVKEAGVSVRKTCVAPDGVTIVYSAAGTGETALVFIHGGLADRSFYDSQLQAFSSRYRVVALDLAGHGESGANRRAWTIAQFAQDVKAVVEAEGLRRSVLFGNSLGGPVAIEAALLLPGRVLGVVGIDTFQDVGHPDTPEYARAADEYMRQRAEAFRADFAGAMKAMVAMLLHADADPRLVEDVQRRMMRTSRTAAPEVLMGVARYDVNASARALGVPLRAINGDLYPTDVEAARKVSPAFDVILMPHTGHYPMLEKPEEFNRHVAAVVAALEERR